MSIVDNERLKLLANALNTLATTAAAGGILAPTLARFYGLTAQGYDQPLSHLIAAAVIWLIVAGALHSAASLVLGGLADDPD